MQNHGVTINLHENNKVDLKEILQVVGNIGKKSTWKVSAVECFGESSEVLHNFSANEKEISGKEFYNVVSNILQTSNGEFVAFDVNEKIHWLLIRAIRGESFDIETDNKELLNKIHNSFQNVKDLIY